ncbi:MAG TPA: hypothetical protein ENJ31_08165, partial [Anaerolineae bacterium]|nr:hypothetical protein [Anaerolineae bacterium]
MRMLKRSGVWVGLLILLLAACGRQQTGQTTAPSVVITAPVAGQQIPQGTEITIIAAAADNQGVTKIEVGVDGVLLGVFENPAPAATVPFEARQTWTAAQPGPHAVMAVAYNTAGVASAPAAVNITVVESGGAPSPTTAPTTAAGPPPTPTWTPIAVSSPSPAVVPAVTAPPTVAPPTATSPPAAKATATRAPSGGGSSRPAAPGPITDFEKFGKWKRGDQPNGTFTQSAEQAHSGAYAGKLAYNFPTGGNDFVVFLHTFPLGGRPNRVSAWVYGDGRKHYLNIWIKDAKGETWQFTMGQVKHTGWQQMDAWIDPTAPWPAGHIDGPSNGAVDYPIDFRALVLDDVPDSFAGSGAIYIDDLSCAQASPPPPTPTPTTPPSAPAPVVSFRADATTLSAGSCTRLRWDVENVREVYLDGQGV